MVLKFPDPPMRRGWFEVRAPAVTAAGLAGHEYLRMLLPNQSSSANKHMVTDSDCLSNLISEVLA